MPGGIKSCVINTQERAISTDLNRLQAFLGSGFAEFMHHWLNISQGTDDDQAGGAYAPSTSAFSAEVVSGLLVQPELGTLNLSVSAGVMMALNLPLDPDPDASPYKFVFDPGVGTGVISMTANSSGSMRIDVVEVQVTSVVSETDTRDLFDPTTGLFSPTLVTKARQHVATQLGGSTNVQVRMGTPGAGYPGTVSGWLPLAVAFVGSGVTSNNNITFWDVRPLLSDRAYNAANVGTRYPQRVKTYASTIPYDSAPAAQNQITPATTVGLRLSGHAEAVLNGRRVGGVLRSGAPLLLANEPDSVDLLNTLNYDASTSGIAGQLYFLYLLTPFGLPRWARYTNANSGQRVPRSPRGIPILSNTPPDTWGNPSTDIALPTSWMGGSAKAPGNNGGVSEGVMVAAAPWLIPYGGAAVFPMGFYGDGDWIRWGDAQNSSYPLAATIVSSAQCQFTIDFAKIPKCAKAVRFWFKLTLSAPGTPNVLFFMLPANAAAAIADGFGDYGNGATPGGLVETVYSTAASSSGHIWTTDVMLPAAPLTGRASQTFVLYVTTLTATALTAMPLGFKM